MQQNCIVFEQLVFLKDTSSNEIGELSDFKVQSMVRINRILDLSFFLYLQYHTMQSCKIMNVHRKFFENLFCTMKVNMF